MLNHLHRNESPKMSEPRILIVDDEPKLVRLAQEVLLATGFAVIAASNGQQAVEMAALEQPDLILLDIRMPRLDGLETAQRIRAGQGPCAGAPIVALTADAGETERAQAFKAGMDDFLTKPIDAARLLAVAERFTGGPNPATFSRD